MWGGLKFPNNCEKAVIAYRLELQCCKIVNTEARMKVGSVIISFYIIWTPCILKSANCMCMHSCVQPSFKLH